MKLDKTLQKENSVIIKLKKMLKGAKHILPQASHGNSIKDIYQDVYNIVKLILTRYNLEIQIQILNPIPDDASHCKI